MLEFFFDGHFNYDDVETRGMFIQSFEKLLDENLQLGHLAEFRARLKNRVEKRKNVGSKAEEDGGEVDDDAEAQRTR